MFEVLGAALLMALMSGARSEPLNQSRSAMEKLLGLGRSVVEIDILFVARPDEEDWFDERMDLLLDGFKEPETAGMETIGEVFEDEPWIHWRAARFSFVLLPDRMKASRDQLTSGKGLADWMSDKLEVTLGQRLLSDTEDVKADPFDGDFVVLGWRLPNVRTEPGLGSSEESVALLGLMASPEALLASLTMRPGELQKRMRGDAALANRLRKKWDEVLSAGSSD